MAALGHSCGMQDISLQHVGFSVVVVRGLQSAQAQWLQRTGSRARGLCSCGTWAL